MNNGTRWVRIAEHTRVNSLVKLSLGLLKPAAVFYPNKLIDCQKNVLLVFKTEINVFLYPLQPKIFYFEITYFFAKHK